MVDILERFTRTASAHGSAEALRHGARSLRYRDLAAVVATLEDALRQAGLGPGQIVVVQSEDRVFLVPLMLAVFRTGAVFVPFDPGAPPGRTRQLLESVTPDALITDASTASPSTWTIGEWAGRGTRATVAAGPFQGILQLPARRPRRSEVGPLPASFDYLYFTSGSTDRPKGICGRLPGISNLVDWEIDRLGLGPGCAVAQFTVPTFDAYLRDVFVPLCAGGTSCIPPAPVNRSDPAEILAWLERERIGLVHTVPSLLAGFLKGAGRCQGLGFGNLRWILLSGEPLHSAVIRTWRQLFGRRTRFMNLYGATEATMVQFSHEVTSRDLRAPQVPVGEPIRGYAAEILDPEGRPCRPGEIGEIVIRSRFLAAGYWHDAEATRTAFGEEDARCERCYRTGDLAVRTAEGRCELRGRCDDQVKIGGVRVECREVEAILRQHPMIGVCAVIPLRGAGGATELVAFLEPRFHDRPAIPELRRFLRHYLPWEMLPGRFEVRDRLPQLPNGKIDRRALGAERLETQPGAGAAGAWADALQAGVAEIWQEALSVPTVGPRDDFFDLGGHSLTAMRVLSRTEQACGVRLTVADLFDHPTVADFARHLSALMGARSSALPVPGPAALPPDELATPATTGDGFRCPARPAPSFGRRQCLLMFVVNEQLEFAAFERLAGLVRDWDRSIETAVFPDDRSPRDARPDLPTLAFSPAAMRHPLHRRGRVLCNRPLPKSEELRRLARADIPVPDWVLLTEDRQPDCGRLGDYVVRKPDLGAKGARVQIVKRNKLRWTAMETEAAGPSPALLVQRFVYTGLRPVSYRVNTLFGRVLYAIRLEGNPRRPPLRGPGDFRSAERGDGVSIVSNARDSLMTTCDDEEIIRLGERAASAMPECPLLGVDIVREHDTGRLFVLEVNSIGYNWNFTAREAEEWPVNPARQFDGERKAAWLLADQAQRLAE